ncbi:histidine kinase [Belliella pelovolcani]|nr:histidine kinase [Belliella pelovolcani]
MPSVVAMEMPYLKFFMIELIRCFHFSILAALVCFILISFKKLKEQYSIQLAARQAELAQYQLMMNPHFIANGLNAIQSDFILGDARAKDNLVTFTEMLTYCFTNSTQKIIKLSEELACIEKFIQFQKHRYGKKLHLSYELKDEAQYCSVLEIPKMTLLTLVENVFKHGRVNDQNCAPIIQISILPDEKYITVLVAIKNAVNENNKAVISSKSGFLAVSHILKSYFDDRYDLSYFSQGDLFTLNLILKYER